MRDWKQIAKEQGYEYVKESTFYLWAKDSDGFIFKFVKQKFPTRKQPRGCTTPTEYFIFQIKDHHSFNNLDFTSFKFTGRFQKGDVTCKVHNRVFQIAPSSLYAGKGCDICARELVGIKNRSLYDDVVERCNSRHSYKYSYLENYFQDDKSMLKISCNSHGVFAQATNKHLAGQGCPICAKDVLGYKKTAFMERAEKNSGGIGILYVLACQSENEMFYKVGITTLSIKERYRKRGSMPYSWKIIAEFTGSGYATYDAEKYLLREMKEDKYIPLIRFQGYSECFSNLPNMAILESLYGLRPVCTVCCENSAR